MGQLIGGVTDVPDPYDCLARCQDTAGCTWFTSDSDLTLCSLYATCDDFNDCDSCVSGMDVK